jgi:DNA-binding MarR family transcriptional regulator
MSGEPVGEFGPLAAALLDAATAVARVERMDVATASVGVTSSQLVVLRQLAEHGPSAMLDLAAGVGVTGPTMTSTVRILLRKGLVERRHEDEDWRTVLVSITVPGQGALAAASAQRVALISGAMQALSVEQRALLTVALPALQALGSKLAPYVRQR